MDYTPQAGDVIIPGARAVTERLSRVGGFIAGCGWASLLVIANLVNGHGTSPADVTAVIKQAVAEGLTLTPSGVATPNELSIFASNDLGVHLQAYNWQDALKQFTGIKPIELGVGNARAFGGADSGVSGHFITIVGRTASGDYIVSDPWQPASEKGQFVTYTAQQIANANPFSALVPKDALQGGSGSGNPFDLGGLLTKGAKIAQQDLITAGKFAGWFLVAIAVMLMGAYLLIPEQTKQKAAEGVKTAAKLGAEAAVV